MTFLLPPLFSARRQLTLRSIFICFSLKNLLTCVNTYIGGIAMSNDSPNETKNIRLYAVQCVPEDSCGELALKMPIRYPEEQRITKKK